MIPAKSTPKRHFSVRGRLRQIETQISSRGTDHLRADAIRAEPGRIDSFQATESGFDAMLLSPRAGGVGLTITSANHVIHLARWWNPAVEDQSTARVHRIGQKKPVKVHLPLATLNDGRKSFDENLHALLERKRRLMRDALLPPELDESEFKLMLQDSLTG